MKWSRIILNKYIKCNVKHCSTLQIKGESLWGIWAIFSRPHGVTFHRVKYIMVTIVTNRASRWPYVAVLLYYIETIQSKQLNIIRDESSAANSGDNYHPHYHFASLNPLSTKLYLSNLKTHFVPRSKHSMLPFLKTDKLMLCREIIAVCSDIHAKQINTL